MKKSKKLKAPRTQIWRVNYVVTYKNKDFAEIYRKPVLEILRGIAFVQEIECEISYEHAFDVEKLIEENKNLKDYVSDLVYFRSSANTRIRCASLRRMIDQIFDEFGLLGVYPIFVFSQMQKSLPQFPFPT